MIKLNDLKVGHYYKVTWGNHSYTYCLQYRGGKAWSDGWCSPKKKSTLDKLPLWHGCTKWTNILVKEEVEYIPEDQEEDWGFKAAVPIPKPEPTRFINRPRT